MSSVALRRALGGGAVLDQPCAGRLLPAAGERVSDGAESDALRFPATDPGGASAGTSGGLEAAAGDLRGRGVGAAEFASLGGGTWRRATATDQHVRDHGDDGACDLS